jgi:hypothetical protein
VLALVYTSIAFYSTLCKSNGQIFLNYFVLNEPRPGAPPAVRALEQALSWTIGFPHALEPVVSPGYPAGVGRKTAGQALLRFCPLFGYAEARPAGEAGRASVLVLLRRHFGKRTGNRSREGWANPVHYS